MAPRAGAHVRECPCAARRSAEGSKGAGARPALPLDPPVRPVRHSRNLPCRPCVSSLGPPPRRRHRPWGVSTVPPKAVTAHPLVVGAAAVPRAVPRASGGVVRYGIEQRRRGGPEARATRPPGPGNGADRVLHLPEIGKATCKDIECKYDAT